MKLSAVDCLGRGWKNLLANWELIVVVGLQTLVLFAVLGTFLMAPLVALGLSLDFKSMNPEILGTQILEKLSNPASLALGCIGFLVFLFLIGLVIAYVQAGLYGILYAGDRQAPPDPGAPRESFRVFSFGRFFAGANRLFGRFFGYYNLAGLLAFGAFLVASLWLGLLGLAADSWGTGAALAVGCVGALPVFFLVVVLSLALALAKGDLARPESGAWRAIRLGLDVLARRPAANLLFLATFALVGIGVAVVFFPLGLGISLGLSSSLALRFGAHLGLWILQSAVTVGFHLFQSASFTALMQSEVAPRFPDLPSAPDLPEMPAPEMPAPEVPIA